jgi:hypothetical protein
MLYVPNVEVVDILQCNWFFFPRNTQKTRKRSFCGLRLRIDVPYPCSSGHELRELPEKGLSVNPRCPKINHHSCSAVILADIMGIL